MEGPLKNQTFWSDKASHLHSIYGYISMCRLRVIIILKLPTDVHLQMDRIAAKEVWEIQELLCN